MRTIGSSSFLLFLIFLGWMLALSCGKPSGPRRDSMADTPKEVQQKTTDLIRNSIREVMENNGMLPDSTLLRQPALVKALYDRSSFTPLWCHEQNWLSPADSLMRFIRKAQYYGLFPEDYHEKKLAELNDLFSKDNLMKTDRRDAALWTKADLLLSDAFMQIIRDVKLGRLPNDSLSHRKDSLLTDEFCIKQFDALQRSVSLHEILGALEPKQRGYQLLKEGITRFLDSADYREYTKVPPPGKDLVTFKKALQRRLYEGGYIAFDSVAADSSQLAEAVKRFQKDKGIAIDGRAGEGTVRMLNVSDRERFIRIAISMDKFKMLPEEMPGKYIWVNASGNYLELIENNEVKLTSKVICGKPRTRTPLLTSQISELITYPQWVPPPSIVQKEILPAVKKNPGYLSKKGFSLLDKEGNEVDPYTVDWSKYSKGIPYRVVQGSGDANALGIMKFVFSNKYSVYLHDTNQRYLFSNSMRSLSHGCVRVKEWDKLAEYIIRSDNPGSATARIDSMNRWLEKKMKKSIPLKNRMPVYIRYLTAKGHDGAVVFFDDIYGEDKMLREKYFAGK